MESIEERFLREFMHRLGVKEMPTGEENIARVLGKSVMEVRRIARQVSKDLARN